MTLDIRARRALGRLAVVGLAAGAVVGLGATTASADTSASLSDLRSVNGTVSGTLVLRGVDPTTVDPGKVRARLAGKPATLKVSPATGKPRTTMLVIDTSGSMGTAGMSTVRAAVKDFLAVVPKDVKVGVVSFASTAGVDVKPTLDRRAVQKAVNGLRARGETSLYEAVRDAVPALGRTGERSIILLSDGEDTVAENVGGTARERSQRAAAIAALTKAKVRAEVIRFKNDAGGDVLAAFAKAGGGSVVSAADRAAVQRAFAAAARALESQLTIDVTVPAGVVGTAKLVVDGEAAGVPFSASQEVDLGVTAPVVEAPSADAEVGGLVLGKAPAAVMDAAPLVPLPVSLALIAVSVFAIVLSVFGPAFRARRHERVAQIDHYGLGVAQASASRGSHPGAISEQLVHMGDKVMSGRESTTKTMRLLERADLPWRAGEWFVIRILAVVVGIVVGVLVLGGRSPIIAVLVGLVAGFLLPSFALRFLANRRARKFEAVLPDVMMLVATSLSSGFSLLQALDSVARDAAEPAAKEFSRALAESRIGTDISDALEHAAERMASENMRWAVMAIRIQREVGGNLAETLRTTAATLREREQLKRHVKALSAEGRLSAYILIALPIGIFFYSMWTNYDYVSLLWTTFLGMAMLGAGIVSMILGVVWMRATVKIEV